jgi:hypothetical protein
MPTSERRTAADIRADIAAQRAQLDAEVAALKVDLQRKAQIAGLATAVIVSVMIVARFVLRRLLR